MTLHFGLPGKDKNPDGRRPNRRVTDEERKEHDQAVIASSDHYDSLNVASGQPGRAERCCAGAPSTHPRSMGHQVQHLDAKISKLHHHARIMQLQLNHAFVEPLILGKVFCEF